MTPPNKPHLRRNNKIFLLECDLLNDVILDLIVIQILTN